MQLTLLAVATSDPEHTRTIGCGTGYDTNADANRAGTSGRAAAGTGIRVVARVTTTAIAAAAAAAAVSTAARQSAATI